jgi:hypothetical protein
MEVVAAIIGAGVTLLIVVGGYAIRLELRLRSLDSRLVQVGEISLPKEASNARDLWEPPPEIDRRQVHVHIEFDVPFSRQPKVITSLTEIDLGEPNAHTHRITIRANNVGLRGFDLYFETWHNSRIYNATASWVAIAHG